MSAWLACYLAANTLSGALLWSHASTAQGPVVWRASKLKMVRQWRSTLATGMLVLAIGSIIVVGAALVGFSRAVADVRAGRRS